MESPNSFTAAVCASKWCTGALPARSCDGVPQRRARHLEVGVAREIGGRHLVVGEHHRGVVRLDGLQHLVGGRHHQVAAEHQVGARHAGADGMDLLGVAWPRACGRPPRRPSGRGPSCRWRRSPCLPGARPGRARPRPSPRRCRRRPSPAWCRACRAPAASAPAGSPACWRRRCRRTRLARPSAPWRRAP